MIVGGLVLLLLLVAVLVPALVPREKLRSIAEERAREMTGGEVSLGELSLSVFPRLKLVLGESTLRVDRAGLEQAGQIPGPLLEGDVSLERLEVDLALLPLLSRQFEFGEVRLISPRVSVVTEAPADDVAAGAGDTATPGIPASGETGAAAPGGTSSVGLALAAVEVRDGELAWTEEGTGRAVTVRGWQQDLSAPELGVIMQRLQRLNGFDVPDDELAGPATLKLASAVEEIVLVGFAESELPPLQEVSLRGELTMPADASRAVIEIAELTTGELVIAGTVRWSPTAIDVPRLSIAAGDAVELTGRAGLVPPPGRGALTIGLDGTADLARVMALAGPLMPPRPEDAAPLPELAGSVELQLAVELTDPPALDDPEAWQTGWQEGLAGRAEARILGGGLTVRVAELDDPIAIESVTVTSDLASARGRTRATVQGLVHPAFAADASMELTLPPASGPLALEAEAHGQLAAIMATAESVMPPRPADAAPLPDLAGEVNATVAVDLPTAPSLADTAAWRTAWTAGLSGRAELTARATKLRVAVPQLGPPLTIARVDVTSDLRSPRGRTVVEAGSISHPVIEGDATLELVPQGDDGAIATKLTLDQLDLDALAEIARAQQEASAEQARGSWLVPTASAAEEAAQAVGELIPVDLAVDLDARLDRLVFLKAVYTQVEAGGTLRERVIDVPRLSARLDRGRIDGSARIDYASDPYGKATWEAQVQDAPASALLSPYAPDLAGLWSGALRADLAGACSLADAEAIRNSLTLEGDVAGTDGSIDLRQSLGDVSQYLGSRQDLLRVVYDGIDQHLKIREGKVIIEGLRVDGKQTDWRGDGWISLDGRIEMGLNVKLPAGFTPDLGDLSFVAEALRGDDGRIALDLLLTGPSARPKVSLDIDPTELMKNQNLLEEGVKKGLGGLLDRLGGK
jgi:hypothetical protein